MEIWAEVGQCEGDIQYALDAVDAVSEAGAEVIKVQVLRPEWIASPGAKRYDAYGAGLLQRDAFDKYLGYEAWKDIAEYAHKNGLRFIAAVFDEEAAREMGDVADELKIASGDITNRPLIEAAVQEGRGGLTLSTGAATSAEVITAVHWIQKARRRVELTLLACHLQYPSHPGDAHLGRVLALGGLIHQLGWKTTGVGYSDHTTGTSTTPLLVAMGVAAQEKHFTLKGPGHGGDHEFAVDAKGLKEMCQARDTIVNMFGNIELEPTDGERAARVGARRSIHALRDIRKGEMVSRENTAPLRPFVEGALQPAEWEETMKFKAVAMEDMAAGEAVMRKLVGNVGAALTVE